jgi:hypothetical protein
MKYINFNFFLFLWLFVINKLCKSLTFSKSVPKSILNSVKNQISGKRFPIMKSTDQSDIISMGLIYENYFYVVLSVGTPSQKLVLALDTQRNLISLVSNKCKSCGDGVPSFDDSISSSFKLKEGSPTIHMYKYQLLGRNGQDLVDFNVNDLKLNSTDLILIDKVLDNNSFNQQGFFGIGFTKNKEDNFIFKIKSEGKIKNAVAGILMRGNMGLSELHLGGYNTKLINDTDKVNIKYSDIIFTQNDTFTEWYLPAKELYLNNNYSDYDHKIILGSSSNIIRIPGNYFFENLNKIFQKQSECQIWKDNLFHCKCNNDYKTIFPTFKFTLNLSNSSNRTNLTITPDDYIMLDNSGMQPTDSSAYCVLLLSPNYMNDYWILGINFMNDYYTIFDYENSRIGFYDIDSLDLDGFENIIFLSIIIMFSSVLFFSVLYCVYKKIVTRRSEMEQNLIDN